MFNLHLSAEQLEFRDTVREFAQNEIRPAALRAERLEPFAKPLLAGLMEAASRMGLRTLALSEGAGGAGADTLTSCIVMEELAAGDVDLAVILGLTSELGHALFDVAANDAQRSNLLPRFLDDNAAHRALVAAASGAARGWTYHRAQAPVDGTGLDAVKQANGQWLIDGAVSWVSNAPVAKLLVVQARTDPAKSGRSLTWFLVPADTPGVSIERERAVVGEKAESGERLTRWHHGAAAAVRFDGCRVAADLQLGPFPASTYAARAAVVTAAINLGVGRAAYEAAVEYAKIRVQGGRPIVQHQSIGGILADITIKLELARNIIWKAAWALDHPEAVADRSIPDLPLHTLARTYTAEAMHEATLGAAECFGAMGVMRDMPMQKYVHDALVLLHAPDHDSATRLEISEAVAGYERPLAA